MRAHHRIRPAALSALTAVAVLLLLAVHVAATIGILSVGRELLGGAVVTVLLLAVVALHVAGFRRLAARRDRDAG